MLVFWAFADSYGRSPSVLVTNSGISAKRFSLPQNPVQGRTVSEKFDAEFLPDRFAARRVIDRDGDQLRTRRAKVFKMLRIVRQLAEAERSPMSAVENHDAHSTRDQIVEPAHDAGRIGERKLGSFFTDRRNLAFIHASTIAALAL